MNSNQKQKGFIKTIILLVIAFFILKIIFKIDLFNNEIVKDILDIIKGIIKVVWQAIVIVLDFLKLAITKTSEFLNSLSN